MGKSQTEQRFGCIVGGVPGVGKTEVVSRLESRLGWSVFNVGTAIMELAAAKHLAKDRDELRALPGDILDGLRLEACARAPLGPFLVDSHFWIKTPTGWSQGIDSRMAGELGTAAICLIETNPAVIAARRKADSSRRRDPDEIASIVLHQQMNRELAANIAAACRATLSLIDGSPTVAEVTEQACRVFSRIRAIPGPR